MEYPSFNDYIKKFEKMLKETLDTVPKDLRYDVPGEQSIVFHCRDENEEKYIALQCWSKEIEHLEAHYKKVSDFISSSQVKDFFISPIFLKDSICINDNTYPSVYMDCSGGITLKAFIHKNKENKALMRQAADAFQRLVSKLHSHSIAHGNLTDQNIFVFPKKNIFSRNTIMLKLINYDFLYIPQSEIEEDYILNGHICFQHPVRMKETGKKSCKLDYYSELVIYLSLQCMTVQGNLVWLQYDMSPSKEGLVLCNNENGINISDDECVSKLAYQDDKIKFLINKLKEFNAQKSIDALISLDQVLEEYKLTQREKEKRIFLNSFISLKDNVINIIHHLKDSRFREVFVHDRNYFFITLCLSVLIYCILNQTSASYFPDDFLYNYREAIIFMVQIFIYKLHLQINILQVFCIFIFSIIGCFLANYFIFCYHITSVYSIVSLRVILCILFVFLFSYVKKLIFHGIKLSNNEHLKPIKNIWMNINPFNFRSMKLSNNEHLKPLIIIWMIINPIILFLGACIGYNIVWLLSDVLKQFTSVPFLKYGIGTGIFYFVLFYAIKLFIKYSFNKVLFNKNSILLLMIFCGIADGFIELLLFLFDSHDIIIYFSLAIIYASMACGILLGIDQSQIRLTKTHKGLLILIVFCGALIGDILRDTLQEKFVLTMMNQCVSTGIFLGVLTLVLLTGLWFVFHRINSIQIIYFSFCMFLSAFMGEWLKGRLIDLLGPQIIVQYGIGPGILYGIIGFGVLFSIKMSDHLTRPIYLKSAKKI